MSSSLKAFLGLFAAAAVAQSTTSPPTPGQTLSNGAYACNPAHSYPAGASCDGKASPPTLVYSSVTTAPSAGYTLSNGAYVCNPAHSYPAGASCDGKASPPTLVYPSTTAAPSAGYTLSNGAYVCNPAHSYPTGASCDGKASPPTLVYPSTTAAPSAGYTLSNGAYVCNPAHSYPAGASCDGKASPPTLVYLSTTSAPSAGYTLSNGAYVCNPAHSYPAGASCDGKASPPTLVYPSTTLAVSKTTLTTSIVSKSSVATPTSSATGCTAAIQSAQPSGKACPLTLAGTDFQFPHLIVLSSDGKTTGTTQYNGTISAKTTSYFNFDIPPAYAGKTCDVVFSLPRQDQLETSSFHLGGSNGNLVFSSLETAASENGNVPKASAKLGSWTPTPGYHFAVASGSCAAGQRIGYSVVAEGDRYLDYFQDYNPCPIGLYVIAH